MTGIFFLGVVGVYVFLISHLVSRLTRGIRNTKLQLLAGGGAFLLLLALPLADEIVGAFQFHALCKANAVLRIDAEKAKGKVARLVITPVKADEIVPGVALPIYHSHFSFVDVVQQEELGQFDRYSVKGGWFFRALGFSTHSKPLLIQPAACSPGMAASDIAKKYEFTLEK